MHDDGSTGTLRWAIIEANNSSVPDTIAFSSLFETPQTIFLTQGPLTLEGAATTTIAGPGASLLTINAGGASRVFEVQDGPAVLSGLTVTDGTADVGGGLYNSAGTLAVTDVTVSGNTATAGGGGLATVGGGSTTLTNCIVSGNTAQSNGGGLYNDGGGTTLTNCTVTGNTTQLNGGGCWRASRSKARPTTAALALCRAIGLASGDTQHDTTVFSSLFKTPQTIDLTGGELELTGSANTTITGPGANLLTINSHQASRVFYFNASRSDRRAAQDSLCCHSEPQEGLLAS